MATIHSLLVGTDFSGAARQAVLRAARLAAELGVERARVAHALERSVLRTLSEKMARQPAPDEEVYQKVAEALDALVAGMREETGASMEPVVLEGRATDAIAKAAAADDLLVVGARGSGGVRDFAIGSTAQRVVYRAGVPVLVVRTEPTEGYRNVLAATDFSDSALRALKFVPAVAPRAALHVANVYQGPYEANMIHAGVSDALINDYRDKVGQDSRMMMTQLLHDAGLDKDGVSCISEPGYPPRKLLEIARDRKADLLVVVKHGLSDFGDALLGGVAWHLLAEAPCDVLVVQ